MHFCVFQKNLSRAGRGKESHWKFSRSETNDTELKAKDVCNLRSHVLSISGISSLDNLVNKLNYMAIYPV